MASPVAVSSPVAISSTDVLDWKKMNKQELIDALASRGLDTSGIRLTLINRLQSSCKAAAATAEAAVPQVDGEKTDFQDAKDNQGQENNIDSSRTADKVTDDENDSKEGSDDAAVKQNVAKTKVSDSQSGNVGITGSVGPLTDLEKKQKRAERFGMELQVSEEEKRRLRASRFGGTPGKTKTTSDEPETEKRKQRAARFGIVDDESRKRARQERFGPASKQNGSVESDKRKARAARFGAATESRDANTDKKADTNDGPSA